MWDTQVKLAVGLSRPVTLFLHPGESQSGPAVEAALEQARAEMLSMRTSTPRFVVERAPVQRLVDKTTPTRPGIVKQGHDYGFIPGRLGPRILRTETAALAALAALNALAGDF